MQAPLLPGQNVIATLWGRITPSGVYLGWDTWLEQENSATTLATAAYISLVRVGRVYGARLADPESDPDSRLLPV